MLRSEQQARDETNGGEQERAAGLDVHSTGRGGRARGTRGRGVGGRARAGRRARSTGGAVGGRGAICSGGHRGGLEGVERLFSSGVDGKHHSLGAVTSLTAVEPEGAGDVGHGEAVLHEGRRVRGNGLEAGVNTTVAHVRAWVGKRRLRDGVVLRQELEGNDVAVLGSDLRRAVRQCTVLADLDGDGLGKGSTNEGESSEDGSETHDDYLKEFGWIDGLD